MSIEKSTCLSPLGIALAAMGLAVATVGMPVGATAAEPKASVAPPNTEVGHPDLDQGAVVDSESLAEAQRRIQELLALQMSEVTAATVQVPDYRPIFETFQKQTSVALVAYLEAMGRIKREIAMFYSELNGLGAPGTPFFERLLKEHIKMRLPGLNQKVNQEYQTALNGLFNLQGLTKLTDEGDSQLYEGCQTKACVLKLSVDLMAWREFVSQLNFDIDFMDFPTKRYLALAEMNPLPVVSMALVNAAQGLLKGVTPNESHPLGDVAIAIARAPVGVAAGILSVPAMLFENSVKGLKSLLGTTLRKVELNAQAVDTPYSNRKMRKLVKYGANRAMDRRTRTVYFDGEWEAEQRAKAEAERKVAEEKAEAARNAAEKKAQEEAEKAQKEAARVQAEAARKVEHDRASREGRISKTESGAEFTRVLNHPELGKEVWMDPAGVIWGEFAKGPDGLLRFQTYYSASDYCHSLGAELPSSSDLVQLESYMVAWSPGVRHEIQKIQILNVESAWWLTEEQDWNYHRGFFNKFVWVLPADSNGQVRVLRDAINNEDDARRRNSFRCVIHPR
jgi:hypothetical protein